MVTGDDVLALLDRFRAEGTPCALVTVVRAVAPTSGKPGEKAVVMADGSIHGWIGGGCAQPAVVRTVEDALADGEPRFIRIAPPESAEKGDSGVIDFNMGCASRGTLDLFVEPMLAPPIVRIHGSAPTARHLAGLVAMVGLRAQILAPETDAAEFPGVQLHAARPDAPAVWPAPRWSVVATQGRGDRAALEAALLGPAQRIALIASERKRDTLVTEMAARGVSAERLALVQAPAGIDIAARTPAEIALSVVAQLIQWRRGDLDQSPQATALLDVAPDVTGRCCGGQP